MVCEGGGVAWGSADGVGRDEYGPLIAKRKRVMMTYWQRLLPEG